MSSSRPSIGPDVRAVRPFLERHHLDLADEVTSFCRRQLAFRPHPETDPDGRQEAREILGLLGAGGWCRYAVPGRWGGALEAVDLRSCCLIREALAAVSPLGDAVFALQCLGSLPLVLAGQDGPRGTWLPRVAQGEVMTAFAMTEPEAGSDLASITTRARRTKEGWILTGKKTLISNAGIADLYCVFASTDPEAGRQGLSCFVVPAGTLGLHFSGPQLLSEPHPLGELVFDGCALPAEALLGEEGQGFELGLWTLDHLRSTVAAAACGMAGRALAEALQHARERQQFGRALARFQLIQDKLARMATDLAAARLLAYRAAWCADRGSEELTVASSMAKAFATEAAQRIVDEAVQIVGGQGVLAGHPVDRLYRSVRALRIYEGTTEIQRLNIARRLLRER